MPVYGLSGSHGHVENGMIRSDMRACAKAADKLDEVIIFRSTGPWSRRWIFRGYPTKNFHVKGKSSDWGPQAGFVPHLGEFSKVGDDATKAAKGTAANEHGIKDGFASRSQLVLSEAEILMQLTEACESPPRTALYRVEKVMTGNDRLLWARRSGDGRLFVFRAVKAADGRFGINVVKDCSGTETAGTLANKPFSPLEVMTSSESGANNMPMTGDYDLMAVCPRWGNYGSTLVGTVSKPGLQFGAKQQPGDFYYAEPTDPTHTHVVIDMEDGAKLEFNDPRRFGYMDLIPEAELETHPFFKAMGPEPLGNHFHEPYLKGALAKKKAPIKAWPCTAIF